MVGPSHTGIMTSSPAQGSREVCSILAKREGYGCTGIRAVDHRVPTIATVGKGVRDVERCCTATSGD